MLWTTCMPRPWTRADWNLYRAENSPRSSHARDPHPWIRLVFLFRNKTASHISLDFLSKFPNCCKLHYSQVRITWYRIVPSTCLKGKGNNVNLADLGTEFSVSQMVIPDYIINIHVLRPSVRRTHKATYIYAYKYVCIIYRRCPICLCTPSGVATAYLDRCYSARH